MFAEQAARRSPEPGGDPRDLGAAAERDASRRATRPRSPAEAAPSARTSVRSAGRTGYARSVPQQGLGPTITIRGAREHNLKNVDLELPRDQLIVFTGLSGSGKSSLAFDTIYAEGQRRYVESLSAYARQFLGQMDKPDVDFIEGLSPAISIDQKSASRNPRSTVGTITEIYDYLRLLYAAHRRAALPELRPRHHAPDAAADRRPRARSCPRARASRCSRRSCAAARASTTGCSRSSRQQGFTRARVDGELLELADKVDARALRAAHDRGRRRPAGRDAAGIERRLTDSLETALRTRRRCRRGRDRPEGRRATSRRDAHVLRAPRVHALRAVVRGARAAQLLVQLALRRVRACDGLGTRFEVDPELVVPDDDLSIDDGAIAPWSGFRSDYFDRVLEAVADEYGFATDTPWKKLGSAPSNAILYGTGDRAVHVRYKNRYGRQRSYHTAFEGVIPWLERRHTDVGERPRPRADRGLHARGAVPGVRRRAAAAGVARGHDRRQEHLRGRRAVDPRGGRVPRRGRALRARPADRRARAQGGERAAAVPARRRASTTSPSTARRARSPAARRSASGSRRRSAAGSSACSTCSTSRRSACTSATTSA